MNARLPLSIQHQVPAALGPACIALLYLATATGQFDGTSDRLTFPFSLLLLLPPVVRSVASVAMGRPVVTGRLDQRLIGTDLLLLCVALLQSSEGTRSPVALALYAAACGLGLTFGARRIALALALAASALVLAFVWGAVAGGPVGLVAVLLGLIGFAVGPAAVATRARREATDIRRRLNAIEREARTLGKDSVQRQAQVRHASFAPEAVEAELQAMGTRVERWLWEICRTLVSGTGADRCLAYRPAPEGGELQLAAHSPDPGQVAPAVRAREGVFGVVLKTGGTLMMTTVKQPYGGLVYARDEEPIGSLMAVPLLMGEQVWGVLVLDARHPEALTSRDRALVEGIAPLLLSLLDQLADLTAYRRGSGEDKMLHDTSRALAEQESLGAVAQILVERTLHVVGAEAGALALLDRAASPHVVHAVGFDRDPSGLIFPFDRTTSLVAQSIRYEQTIALSALGRDRRPAQLFGDAYGVSDGFSDVMVMPLLRPGSEGEERTGIGAMVLCRKGDRPFSGSDQARVEMLGHQAAAHILNIRLLEESRSQAATDGLTGLPNRRAFVEKLDEMLQRSARFGTPVSLLMIDVDHFKKVNDTYGHPVGDQVLRKLAEILRNSARDAVDMAARYGGEEFAVLLENTPHDGAQNLAERLRQALADETFVHVEGSNTIPFQVTMSVGLASVGDGGESDALVERADQALYSAKESGRNRVVSG